MNAFEAEVQNGEDSCYTQLHKAALIDLDECLSDQIDDIVVGKTGYAFIRAEGLIPRRLRRGC